MFWIQTIRSGDRYCICHSSWKYFKIVRVDVIDSSISVYLTPEIGGKCLLLNMCRGDSLSGSLSSILYQFNINEHLKIEVFGGTITLIGVTADGFQPLRITNRFNERCVFNDFDTELSDIDEEDMKLLDELSSKTNL